MSSLHTVALLVVALGLFSASEGVGCGTATSKKGVSHFRLGSTCYSLDTTSVVSYATALATCKKQGGSLAMAKSPEVNEALLQLARNASFDGVAVWIGLTDKVVENTFVWVDGSTLHWANWGEGAGPRTGMAHWYTDCVGLQTGNGKWRDYNCVMDSVGKWTRTFPYFCQFDN